MQNLNTCESCKTLFLRYKTKSFMNKATNNIMQTEKYFELLCLPSFRASLHKNVFLCSYVCVFFQELLNTNLTCQGLNGSISFS